MHLHWDGDNDSVDERNLSAALGAGVTPVTVDHAAIKRVRDWIWTLPPPKYPVSGRRGAGRARRGALRQHVRRVPRRSPLPRRRRRRARASARSSRSTRIGTDRHRLDSYTEAFAANQYQLFPDSPYRFTHFRKTHGYANHPLDGIWARAPYLHNGSVPTLRDLLEPPGPAAARRSIAATTCSIRSRSASSPTWREENGRQFSRYDTSVPGNGNGGHVYGTTLSDADKAAIVEYMKTF